MTQILIILQGLAYVGLIVTLLARFAERRWPGPRGILAATAASLAFHLLLTFLIPAPWHVTWWVFVIPGHILTPALLIMLARRNTGG
ncbi:MAG TPA: hypothetical protein VGN96_15720 [Roseococcus sp.]|nr:hypothetical protein [Roseococcus sp.]